ncbi:MAG TPA: transporter substrate-binding domain-containing protein [Bacteroidales bacterium]|nr:transporter substrate-binding domain-containing protein [Bacteroidales bacterium]
MKHIHSLLLVFLLALVFGTVRAENSITVKVGIYENPPKVYLDSTGKPAGIFILLLEEIAKAENWNLVYSHSSWEGCITALQQGKIDILPDMAFSHQRNAEYDINAIPVIQSWSQLYARPGMKINSFADLNGKRVTVLKGSVQQNQFDQLMNGFGYSYIPVPVNTFEIALVLVKDKVADVAITNYFFGEKHYQAMKLIKLPLIFNPASLHYAVKKGTNATLLSTIDRYLKNWTNSTQSIYYQILKDYQQPINTKQESPQKDGWRNLILIVAFFALVSIILLRLCIKSQNKTIENSEEKLINEKKKLQKYIEKAPFGILVTNAKGEYIDANTMACTITGYTKKELTGMTIQNILALEAETSGTQHFSSVLQEGKARGDLPFITKTGEKRWWTVNAVKINQDTFIGFVIDITERKNAEDKLAALHNDMEKQISKKTKELQKRIQELEHFYTVTIERELRMEELRKEIELLKTKTNEKENQNPAS